MSGNDQILNSTRSIIGLTLAVFVAASALMSCGGSSGMASPGVYAEQPKVETPAVVDPDPAPTQPKVKPEPAAKQSHAETEAESEPVATHEELAQTSIPPELVSDPEPTIDSDRLFFLSGADIDDSASAVDDDIWRKFDLSREYHAMGVIANREASWEEAQYYFEKGLRIMAKLDVESDSLLTPEAARYNRLLDDIVSDYRVTLRSLGNLEEDVSSSVMLERFGELVENINQDTLVVFKSEVPPVVYDIPIVMNDRVKKSIVYFQTVAREAFKKYLRRSKKYTPMMKKIIRKHGLPEDLIYLSLVESGYNPNAYSWARAMGLWQFISSTGREYGLNRNWWYDERKDPIKATEAACRFLKNLYEEFGCWELAMAAYNGGPGRVRGTIKKQKTIDFWKMRLKRQTMDYVPLIMASAVIAKNQQKYGFNVTEFEPEIVWDEVEIDRCLELSVVAKAIGCSTKELKELNPELLRKYTPPNIKKYALKIPVGKVAKFQQVYADLPSPKETSWVRHKIRTGETVSTIASRYGVSQYAILEANNLSRRSTIYAGKEIIVPVPLDRATKSTSNKNREYSASKSVYKVRPGDTLWDIARAFGTTIDGLRRLNYIGRGSRIYVGQKLKIPSSAKYLASKSSSGPGLYAGPDKNKSKSSSKKTTIVSSSSGKTDDYKVRSGDTLWDIARKYGTTTSNLRRLNGLGRSSRIYPGQVLKIAGSRNYVMHKVRRGESLSRIANRYRTSISRILSTNDLDDPDMLQVGDVLKIYAK